MQGAATFVDCTFGKLSLDGSSSFELHGLVHINVLLEFRF